MDEVFYADEIQKPQITFEPLFLYMYFLLSFDNVMGIFTSMYHDERTQTCIRLSRWSRCLSVSDLFVKLYEMWTTIFM